MWQLPGQRAAQAETEDSQQGKEYDRCTGNSISLFRVIQLISVSNESSNGRLDAKV
jgi:hypothetical protein